MNLKLQRVVALAFVLGGLLCNPWLLSRVIGMDFVNNRYAMLFLFTLDILAVGLGIALFKMQPRTLIRQLLGISFSTGLMLIVAEIGLQQFYYASNKITPPKRFVSKELGWETTPSLQLEYSSPGYGDIQYSTTMHGFRRYGDCDTAKTKVLVLGDSVTQATQVSDGEAFFDVLASHDDLEVFAYGAGGYGSLQEYLILDRHLDTIRPDLLVWQFSDNDFINNDYELECISKGNNNHMVRPYLVDDEIERLYPATRWRFLRQHSYLLRHCMIVASELTMEEGAYLFDELSSTDPRFQKAKETTSQVLGLVRARIGDVPAIAFAAYGGVPHEYVRLAFAEVCRENSIQFLDEVQVALEQAKAEGVAVDALPEDPHWNAQGHEIVGNVVLEYMQRHELVPNEGDNTSSTVESRVDDSSVPAKDPI